MSIFKIEINANLVRRIIFEGDRLLERIIFDGQEKTTFWDENNWSIDNPKIKETNFINFGNSGALVFDQKVYDSDLYAILERAGEILPIKIKTQTYYALNILNVVNCLDKTLTQWEYYDNGSPFRINKYHFKTKKMSESLIFKIPERNKTEIFCCSLPENPEKQFYAMYQKLKFTGLNFEEIYSE